ncbi:MAG: selenide, water dikinase SelD [Phycisphaeraceae bacterium]|nr:selenide, water dikinase SelD [Phycisphaeraceae bacterium]
MRNLPSFADPALLVGADHMSDAGVYQLAPGLAIVQSLDFFPPVVDDPYVYGQIASANALSDLYAMGATPRTALNIVGFPDKELDLAILEQILRGASERVIAAGAVVVGGHSVRDAEIKFGQAVTGVVDPSRMMTNDSAGAGEALVLTKGLGTGVITTALRGDRCPAVALDAATASMIRLNSDASRIAVEFGVRCATDVTGFGVVGHAREVALASGVTLRVRASALPILDGALDLAIVENRSGASRTNREGAPDCLVGQDVQPALRELAYDPQTSGGLLLCIAKDRADALCAALRASGDGAAAIVGEVIPREESLVVVV